MGREGADGNLESKSLGCGGICCNGRKLVSVQGGDCSERSNSVRWSSCLVVCSHKFIAWLLLAPCKKEVSPFGGIELKPR